MSATPNPVVSLRDELAELRSLVLRVLDRLDAPASERRTSYSIEEAAQLLGRAPYTVREWARHGRINAIKSAERRGGAELWRVPAEEIDRIRNEGLLPPATRKAE